MSQRERGGWGGGVGEVFGRFLGEGVGLVGLGGLWGRGGKGRFFDTQLLTGAADASAFRRSMMPLLPKDGVLLT